MTHVFVAPHPDDAALSCGGLIASLRELGQSVTILTVFSGGPTGSSASMEYQRVALGFGTKTMWPNTQAFDRSNIAAEYEVAAVGAAPPWQADPARIDLTQERANTQARQFWQRAAWTRSANVTNEAWPERPIADQLPAYGTLEGIDFDAADMSALRKAEDERYAYFMETALVDLDLPDAVHRGYADEEALTGAVHADDDPPYEILRREILRLEPQAVYFPLGVGNHVDHQLCREAALTMLAEPRSWVMPGPGMADRLSFYEDFPYAWWQGFSGLADLPRGALDLPAGLGLEARYAEISDMLERKTAGLRMYASQIRRLFADEQGLIDDVAGYAARMAQTGGSGTGAAERYWAVVRA